MQKGFLFTGSTLTADNYLVMNKRVFIAIPVPEAVRTELHSLRRLVPPTGLRWTPPEHLHLTLVFMGNTPAAAIPEVEEKLRTVAARHPGFTLQCRAVETVRQRGSVSMIWAGFRDSSAYTALALRLREQLTVNEKRPPLPHITLARSKRGTAPLLRADDFPDISHLQFPVERFELWESTLLPQGSVYSVLNGWQLGGGADSK
jgi:RNA 2',3'-cyclic 3'-phosphodiesterase